MLPRPRPATKHRHALVAPSIRGIGWEGERGARRSKGPSGAPSVFGAGMGRAALVVVSSGRYLAPVSMRILPPGFVPPCLPTKAERPPSGDLWLHEIKHDGFRVIARKDGAKVRPRSLAI